MTKISSQDRAALIRLASSLPVGDQNRKAILAGLQKVEAAQDTGPDKKLKYTLTCEHEEGVEDWAKNLTVAQAESLIKKADSLFTKIEDLQENLNEIGEEDPKAAAIQTKIDKLEEEMYPYGERMLVVLTDPKTGAAWSYLGWGDWEVAREGKKASSARTDPKKIAQEILDELHIEGGAPGPTPKSKYRGQLEKLIANLILEGFVFDPDTEEWGTIISPEDDAAEDLFKQYKSGPKFNNLLLKIFEEDHGDNE